MFSGEADERIIDFRLIPSIRMLLEFQIEVILAEESFIIGNPCPDIFITLPRRDMLGNLPGDGSRESDEMTRIFFEEFEIDARSSIIHTMEIGLCDELDEIMISLDIFGEQHDLIEFIILIPIFIPFF